MKKLLVFAFLIFLVNISAATVTESDQQIDVEYGNDITIEIEDGYGGGDKSDTASWWVDMCGEKVSQESSGALGDISFTTTFNSRSDTPCGWGSHTARVYASGSGDTEKIGESEIDIQAINMDPHKGIYLQIGVNTDVNPPKMRFMFLTNDYPYSDITSPDVSYGPAYIYQHNPKELIGDKWVAQSLNENQRDTETPAIWGRGSDFKSILKNPGNVKDEVKPVVDLEPTSTNEYQWRHPENFNSMTPIHADGSYSVDRELINGAEPEHYDQNGDRTGTSAAWFVCREGATMDTGYGSQTPQVVKSGDQLYKCDMSGNEIGWRDSDPYDWDPVTECQDGLDNNGKQSGIDLNDPACNNNPNTEIEGSSECEPYIGYREENGDKVAFYNHADDGSYVPQDTGCAYQDIEASPEYSGEDPVEFTCSGATEEKISGYEGPTPVKAEEFCSNRAAINTDMGLMPAVQYFVPEEAMQTGGEWANENGYEPNYGFQTLEQAKNTYGSSIVEDNYENASADSNDEIAGASGTLNDPDVFPGGFYGDCSGGQLWQWSEDQGWSCSGAIPWDQTVVAPEYIGEENTAQTVGVYLLPYNFQEGDFVPESEYSFTSAYSSIRGSSETLESLSAVCWVGTASDKPGFDEANKGSTWFETQITGLDSSIESPVPVYGSLDLSPGQKYTCKWGYTLTNGDFSDNIGGSPKIVTANSDVPLQDNWFGSGISQDVFNGRFSSGNAESQFETWNSENSGTSRGSEAKCGELDLSC